MTSITVQRTGFGIVVAESDDAEATAILDGLPPLRTARYLTATPALRDALRSADAEVVDAVLPHLDGEVVVPEAGLAKPGLDGEAESTRLAQALGVSVVAPEGRIVRCEGTLFSVGGGDGWIAQSPMGARVRTGRRYPAPAWQSQLPDSLRGAAHIPAGLWITSGTEPRHAVRLAGIAVRERQLLVVAGSPSEPAPTEERLLAVLRALPAESRSAVVLAGFGAASLPLDTVRSLAAALEQPVRIAHGVEIDGHPVRIGGDDDALPTTLALESVVAPDGTVTLERWAPPPGLVAANAVEYHLGETPTTRRRGGDRWVVHVVAAGLVVRPAGQPLVDHASLEAPAGSLGIFVQCDGAHHPAGLPALLAPLRDRLEQRGAVTIHPVDAAARRVVRDAYPGTWAPIEALAITADGRLVAATADASGDTPVAEAIADAAAAVSVEAVELSVEEMAETREASEAEAPADAERVAEERLEVSPAAAQQHRTRAERRSRTAERAATRSASSEPRETTAAAPAPTTVDAVIGADDAAAATPRESAGAARRRARDEHVTNVPTVDPAAAAWYAAAVRRPTPTDVADESAAPAEMQPAPTPAPAPSVVAEPAAPTAAPAARSAALEPPSSTAAVGAVAAPATPPRTAAGTASDALSRALQGSASTRLIGGGGGVRAAAPTARPAAESADDRETVAATVGGAGERAAATETTTAPAASATPTAAPAAAAPATETPLPADDAEDPQTEAHAAPAPRRTAPAIDVPIGVRSTAEQRHRVRTGLGSRYDVASRTVSQLLAQQPGMRVTGDRSAMLTGLSLVRVFATEPHAEYDLDFHTCLAEGLAMLPTARSVVVRGIPAALDAASGSLLRLRTPLVAGAVDGPAAGPSEALIWTTSGRRLDRVLHGAAGASDVVLPAGVRLRVLGSTDGPASRLLLAEEGADAEQALARLQAAAEARGEVGTHDDDRWFGDLPMAA